MCGMVHRWSQERLSVNERISVPGKFKMIFCDDLAGEWIKIIILCTESMDLRRIQYNFITKFYDIIYFCKINFLCSSCLHYIYMSDIKT